MDQERLIICNTSPLINLAELDLLGVIEALPGQVCMLLPRLEGRLPNSRPPCINFEP
jgi:hypothetical protein